MHLRTYANTAYNIEENDPVNYKLYALRSRAAQKGKKITLEELGRVLFHMAQKRGYQSNRKTQGGDEGTDYLRDIAINDGDIDSENNETIGIHIFKQFEKARRDLKKSRENKEKITLDYLRTKKTTRRTRYFLSASAQIAERKSISLSIFQK